MNSVLAYTVNLPRDLEHAVTTKVNFFFKSVVQGNTIVVDVLGVGKI